MPAATISPWCATCLSGLRLVPTGCCNASGRARSRSARHRFAAKWLVSRLGRFAEAYPEIELKLAALMHRVDFAREDVDLAIRHGDGQWPELDAVNLCTEELFPVCSPSLMTSRGGLHEPEDVLRFPLLHLDDRHDWARWLEAAGVPGERLLHGPILNHASMLIDAAIDGQGIVLARTMLAASDLIAGRLVRPF